VTAQIVEAVAFWRYTGSVFKAVYGRLGSVGGYTKQYLQVSGDAKTVLDRVLHRGSLPSIKIEWLWPGGSLQADWQEKSSGSDRRGQLDIRVASTTVLPFMVGDIHLGDPAVTFPGDPNKATAADADIELDNLLKLDLDPWILAVKLRDQPGVLHARAYLGRPQAGFEERGLDRLPLQIAAAMRALPTTSAGGGLVLSGSVKPRAPAIMARIKSALERDPNVLLVGPPGTGKSVALEDMRHEFEQAVLFDPDQWFDNWSEPAGKSTSTKAVSLVFHPSYGYENFVAGLVPHAHGTGFELRAKPGPLISVAHWAADPGRRALLILDEFNRGPAAAIFGDTLALLDAGKRDAPTSPGATIERPFAELAMEVSAEFSNFSGLAVPRNLKLPATVHIVAAMNSTDRSVAPLDAALRRRFAIIYIGPDYDVLASHLGTAGPDAVPTWTAPAGGVPWTADDVRQLAVRLLMALNSRIALLLGEDFLLGHALLWHVQGNTPEELARSLAVAFDQRIIATLRMTLADQDDALAAVLRIDRSAAGGTLIGSWKLPEAHMAAVASERLILSALEPVPSWQDILDSLANLLRV
jgi:5-methylcytosine-specific restriction protein B